MKMDKILIGLLSILFVAGTASLLFAAPFIVPLDSYPDRGENGWEGVGYATLPEVKADISDEAGFRGMKEIEVTATGLGYGCGYIVMLRDKEGNMRMAEGRHGNSFETDMSGEGSYIFHIDSKMLTDWKHVDIYSQPGCSAASGSTIEKVATLELK